MIKKRHFEIINLIINSYNGITIKNIADLCNVTERSIRYDINEVNVFFKKKNNKDIIEINNNKLKILYDKKEIEKVIREISVGEYYLSEDERTDIFSYEIFLLKNEFILQYFSEKYGLSKTTIRYSLKEVDRVIQEYNLAIEMSNKGYKVVGNEINIRKYIINILRKYLKIIKEKNTEYNPYIDIVEKFLSKNDIEFFKVLISEILNKTKKTVSDEAFETLQLFLLASTVRNKKNLKIKEEAENKIFLSKTPEFVEIQEILKKVKSIEEKDIYYFVDFFLGSYSYNPDYSYFLNWVLIESLIEQFLIKLSQELKINLSTDIILRKELLNHLKPAIYRMKNKFKLTESILKEVKEYYADLYNKTTLSLKIISDFINIPFDEDEAAFITVMVQRAVTRNTSISFKKEPNILIVCGLGYSSSRFLYENINNYFQVNIIDIIPFNQLENYNYLKRADIIISTLDFSLDGIDVITVNPIMNENDIVKLKNYGLAERKNKIKFSELIDSVKSTSDENELRKRLMENFGENIYDDTEQEKNNEKSFINLLSEKSIKLNREVKNLDELTKFTGQTMIASNLVKKEYIEELKNQIIQYGKYILIGEKTILPHGQLLKNVKKTGFSLITLKKGVDFFGSEIRIVICLASKHTDEHLQAILELNRYLKNPDFEKELLNKKTPTEILNYFKTLNKQEKKNEKFY